MIIQFWLTTTHVIKLARYCLWKQLQILLSPSLCNYERSSFFLQKSVEKENILKGHKLFPPNSIVFLPIKTLQKN